MTNVRASKRKLDGVVVSTKSSQTIVVNVTKRVRHPKYNKFVVTSKKYHAHDAENKAKEGDGVTIIESRAYSKLKKWELIRIN